MVVLRVLLLQHADFFLCAAQKKKKSQDLPCMMGCVRVTVEFHPSNPNPNLAFSQRVSHRVLAKYMKRTLPFLFLFFLDNVEEATPPLTRFYIIVQPS